MTKVFGFLVCLLAMAGASQAALLASYTFTNTKAADKVDGSLVADPFNGGGTATNNGASALNWYEHNGGSTTTLNGLTNIGTVTLTPNLPGYSFSFLRVKVKYRAKGDLGSGNKIFMAINDDVNGAIYRDPTGTSNIAGTSPQTDNFYTWDSTLATPVIGDPDSPLSLSLSSFVTPGSAASANNRRVQIDSIEFYGDIVPEPASMAIFGLLGIGAVAGRFRRKK